MVYHFVGDVMDVDQISDKHKISLFDDSRYEDLGGGSTLDGARKTSLNQPLDEYSQSTKKPSKAGRILKREGGDSLYDEQLLEKHLQEETKKGGS